MFRHKSTSHPGSRTILHLGCFKFPEKKKGQPCPWQMTSFIVIAALGSIWYIEDRGQMPERTHVIMEMSKTLVPCSAQRMSYPKRTLCGVLIGTHRKAPSCLRRLNISSLPANMATKEHGGP